MLFYNIENARFEHIFELETPKIQSGLKEFVLFHFWSLSLLRGAELSNALRIQLEAWAVLLIISGSETQTDLLEFE